MGVRLRAAAQSVTIIFLLAVGSSVGWSSRRHDLDDEEFKVVHHRSYCVNAAGKCFSSGQCCKGLVCAAIDDYFGQKPEVPGYCVKEKDLEVCASSADCGEGGRCASLGRTGERYCLPRPSSQHHHRADVIIEDNGINDLPALPVAGHTAHARGGLGASCTYSADCRPHTDNGLDKLCCQNVSRGRQGVRRMCDRVTPISTCISAPRK